MKLQVHPFQKIRDGQKKIEVRLYDEKRRQITIGDTIEFILEPEKTETIIAEVVDLLNYKTFEDLVNDFPTEDFGHTDKEELLKNIYTFYTKEQESKNTVLGIRIRLLKYR